MSNPKNAISQIKNLMREYGFLNDEVKEIFVNAKLVDGTEVKVEGDEVKEGAAVKVVTEDAEVPAPDGVHELESGMKVETKDGVIVKVTEKMKEEEKMGDKEKDKMGEHGDKEKDKMEDIVPVAKDVVEAVVEAMLPLMDDVKVLIEEMKNMKDYMKKMDMEFSSFKKEPAGKKISDGKTEFNKQEKTNDVDAKVASIMSLRNSK